MVNIITWLWNMDSNQTGMESINEPFACQRDLDEGV